MKYKIELLPQVFQDLDRLTNEVAKEVRDYIQKYKHNPLKYSLELSNKDGLNLKGYRKTYVANATHRIVIKV